MSINVFAGVPEHTTPNQPLATIEDFVERYGLASPTPDAARIQTSLEIASATIRRGRRIFTRVTDDTVRVNGPGGLSILLPSDRLPVVAIASVKNLDRVGVEYTIDPADYDWSDNGVIHLNWGAGWDATRRWWTTRRGGVVVTYTHGYDPVPDDVAGVCLDMAKRLYDAAASTTSGADVRSETLGDYTITYQSTGAGALLQSEVDILSEFELPA